MTATDANTIAVPAPFTVLNVVLDSGERLPCLVESATWLPVRVATRWARIGPLEDADIEAIRRASGPRRDSGGRLAFPEVFSSHARLRNWLMFEVALELGIRRGELLKLRLDSLPRAADDGIRILRRP